MKKENVCEEAVYDRLFTSIAPGLRNFLLFKYQNVQFADDTVQEAFLILWKNCKDVSIELAKAYVFKVAQNQMLRLYNKEKVHRKYMNFQSNDQTEASPEFEYEYKELSEKLKSAIEELPDGQREVFLLNRYEDRTYSQIAEMLGVSIKAVEKRMHKALVKLRKVCQKI
ncbi:MAG: sigma-70 family RNA polymerase sigma factor [Bacteroidota bacterium]